MSSFLVAPSSGGFRITVPPDLAFFAGHFPGRPIVPGAALLQLVLQHVDGLEGAGAAAIDRVRFVRPVGAGAELELRLSASGAGEWSFQLHDPNGPVAAGTARTREAAQRAFAPASTAGRDDRADLAAPVDALLPHGPEAILLRRVTPVDGGAVLALARLPSTSPYARGSWASVALIEAAAQATGVHARLADAAAAGTAATPRPGYLVGVKRASLAARVDTDTDLTVRVQRSGGSGPLAIYAAEASRGDGTGDDEVDQRLLHAELSVWTLPSEPPT